MPKKDLSQSYIVSSKLMSILIFTGMWLYIFISRSRVTNSKENYDKNTPYMMVANHVGYADPFFVNVCGGWRAFRNTPYRPMTANKFLDLPHFKWFMLPVGCFPAYEHPKYESGLEAAKKMLTRRQTVVIFPEGKRTKNREAKARSGVSVLAKEPNVRIAPVYLAKIGKYRYKVVHGKSFAGGNLTPDQIMDKVYALS